MRMNSDPAFRLMNSRSAWGIYEETFSLNRTIKYRIYTYIYEENLSRYLGEACHCATISRSHEELFITWVRAGRYCVPSRDGTLYQI